ncbi:hypothetical protein [Methylobacterium durans]
MDTAPDAGTRVTCTFPLVEPEPHMEAAE